MTKIDWNSRGKRFYSTGLDRSVLYTQGNPGVPWFGLYSIEEAPEGAELKSYYMDGYKYLIQVATEEYKATLNALQYPIEFEPCEGINYLAQGLYTTQQERVPFGLSYRTLIGSDTSELGTNYKLHIVYRLYAKPSSRSHTTIHGEASMEIYSWEVESLPYKFPGFKPISQLVVDSRTANAVNLKKLERYLYGSETNDPMLLDPGQVAAVLSGENVDF